MTPLIGMDADEAQGCGVVRVETSSPRGVPDADSARVIRARELGNNSVEVTIAHFKMKVQ